MFIKYLYLHYKYRNFTMIPLNFFIGNLKICYRYRKLSGVIVECGVWKGGMIAAISEIIKDNKYYLFDSFEGLPKAKEIDGKAAIKWQINKQSKLYFDNCKASVNDAEIAMKLAKAKDYEIQKGWFKDTLYKFNEKIAVLRLDGDWYESTTECLENLFDKVVKGGVIIIDDYYTWDGCSRAVHDYLSKNNLANKIFASPEGVCYIIK